MGFESPQLLLLLLLIVPVMRWLWLEGRTVLNVLRTLLMGLAVLCVARPYLNLAGPGIDVVVVADRSRSIPDGGLRSQEELLSLLGTSDIRGEHDRVSVVAFGGEAVIEAQAQAGPVSPRFDRAIDPNASNLSDALRLAARSATPGRKTRLLVLSDGEYTGVDPRSPEVVTALARTPVSYRAIGRTVGRDVAAGDIILPSEVVEGAGFVIRYAIISRGVAQARYTLRRGEQIIARGTRTLSEGVNTFFVRDRADNPANLAYHLEVQAVDEETKESTATGAGTKDGIDSAGTGSEDGAQSTSGKRAGAAQSRSGAADAIPENDSSSALLRVVSAPRVLIASADGAPGYLARVLEAAGIAVDTANAARMDWSAAYLAPYRLVVLENVPLNLLGLQGAESLAEAVRQGVCGLLVTGGEGSLGPGGYHRSPIDPLLPVTMELKEEQRRGVMALVAVLDRSGSMAAQVGTGKTKMDLANAGVAEAIRLMSPLDQVSVIAVDSTPHVIVPLVQADDTRELTGLVLRIESAGGGIFVRTALQAAASAIRPSKLPTRHILLFADAADSEEQKDSVDFAAHLKREGISLSVIGLGTPKDSDAHFLEELARAGDGQMYFTNLPQELPRVFSQEVIRVSQRGFVKQATAVAALPDMTRLQMPLEAETLRLDGYNLTALRKDASCALKTADDNDAPVVAFWQRGRASVGVITAEIDGPYSGTLPTWTQSPRLLVNLARLLAAGVAGSDAHAYTSNHRGQAEVRIEVDEAVADRLRATPLTLRLLSPPGVAPIDVPIAWEGPTSAVARVTLHQPGHYLPVADLADQGVLEAPPLTLPYSPEFLPSPGLEGREVLASLARLTGGDVLVRADDVFSGEGVDAMGSKVEVTHWLALLALLVLVLEVAEKRLAFFEFLSTRRWSRGGNGSSGKAERESPSGKARTT